MATKEDLEDACANFAYEDYDFLDDDKLGSIDRMEGFLFPSTYEFDKNRSAVYTVETMLVYFKTASASRCWRTSRRLRTPCRRSSPWHP